jgi:hypothetical protein
MKNYLILFVLVLLSTLSFAQDFKFKGKTSSIINQDFIRGEDTPDKVDEKNKKVNISFDGSTLLIGKESYKYMWHQNSKVNESVQLNCIERVEDLDYPYIDAKFELEFLPDDQVKIIQFRETSATTFSKIFYTVNIIKTTK